MSGEIEDLAQILQGVIENPSVKLIFAESCTGGNVCGSLVRHCPGISSNVLGSFVVYTKDAKQRWLELTEAETVDCESAECCKALARNVLKQGRKFATNIISLAVVGDLDPDYGDNFHIAIDNDFNSPEDFPVFHYTGTFLPCKLPLTKEQIRTRRIDEVVETCLLKLLWYIRGR